MGRISKGILGGFSGTVGTVVGGTWKGITYMRSKASRRTRVATEAQLHQQAKFRLAIRFVQTLRALFAFSFKSVALRMTGFNSGVSYTLKNAITGTYPTYSLDYTKVLVCRGDLPNAGNPAAVAGAGGIITFTWTDNSGIGKAKPNDKAILVVYCPELNESIFTDRTAVRNTLTVTLDVSAFHGKLVETYIGFLSEDGKDVATSVYTGAVTVS